MEPVCPLVQVEAKFGEGTDESKGAAQSAADDQIAEAEWEVGLAFSSMLHTVTGELFDSWTVSRTQYRFRLTGGNTGYVKVTWEIRDTDEALIDSGVLEYEWDVNDPLNETAGETTMPWPPDPPDNIQATHQLTIVSTICVREEE
ncbi:hypothetical protein [Verrucomicrobium sp. BvORR106]|uniref:hypothetical protein n=1 Tax=Verrucomicrobium sp. BvORR106 TaxID=1403819 RepID=UPI002240F1F1|nr:hypothetical protein [Verrucomicrobium sp. BvORR106]